jgi:hypothetical protein
LRFPSLRQHVKIHIPITFHRFRSFRHLFDAEGKNRHVIDELQAEVDRRWQMLLARCGEA